MHMLWPLISFCRTKRAVRHRLEDCAFPKWPKVTPISLNSVNSLSRVSSLSSYEDSLLERKFSCYCILDMEVFAVCKKPDYSTSF